MVHRDENVVAPVRAVLENVHGRQMPPPDADAGQVGRHQRQRDADIFAVTDQMVGITQLECQPQNGRDGPKSNVALVPVEPDAERLLALEAAAADHAVIDHRSGIGTRLRAGKAEAGNLFAARQPRQPIILLFCGAELQQQFARTERVRHHSGNGRADRAGRQFADHFRMGVGGKAEPAVLLRDDHGEEFLRLQKLPDFRRQIVQFPIDLPVVDHAAEFLDRAVKKLFLFIRQPRRRKSQELFPIGIAGEQIGVPPHVARFNGFALSVG